MHIRTFYSTKKEDLDYEVNKYLKKILPHQDEETMYYWRRIRHIKIQTSMDHFGYSATVIDEG